MFEPRMPEVGILPDMDKVFDEARRATSEDATRPGAKGRNVVIVTPGRMLVIKACPPPGSMPAANASSMEKLIPSSTKRNIAVISFTDLPAVQTDVGKAIPFFGILLGLAYIGHTVWVFEGHPSALAAGCREADVLFVDSGMLPFLSKDWATVAASVMRGPNIFAHERATFKLRRIDPRAQASGP